MSAISQISASAQTAAASAGDSTVASRVPQKVLGQNDFLKLLATQFKTQDPMKPVEDTAFIAQMAQFSALEQSSAMSKDMAALRADQLRVTANSYLGQRVTVSTLDGTTTTGDVTAVDITTGEPRLIVGGGAHALSAVLRVEPGVVSVSRPASAGGASTSN
jgi:flagellar basal-body rod modification protein FlgD